MTARKTKPEFYRARESFVATMEDGELVSVSRGELVRAGHTILKRREHLFESADSVGRFTQIEQATAAPGEKRGADGA